MVICHRPMASGHVFQLECRRHRLRWSIFSLLHYHSLHVGSNVQNGLTIFKVVLIVVFILAGMFCSARVRGPTSHPPATTVSAEKFAVSLIFVSFAYSGWNAAAYLGR